QASAGREPVPLLNIIRMNYIDPCQGWPPSSDGPVDPPDPAHIIIIPTGVPMASPRTERLPLDFAEVNADWLTRTLQPRYPGVVVESMKVEQFIPDHSSKVLLKLEHDRAGREAGVPAPICVKTNYSGSNMSGPECVSDTRLYQTLASRMPVPPATCYFADWDD